MSFFVLKTFVTEDDWKELSASKEYYGVGFKSFLFETKKFDMIVGEYNNKIFCYEEFYMTDLFKEIVPSILKTKEPVVTEENEKDYVPFIVNKALSYHYDCILYVNEINKYPNTDKLLQYHYFLNTIRSRSRPFHKWHKKGTVEDLEAVKEYFNYSNEKAKDALTVLSNEQIDEIKKRLEKGGLNVQKSRRSD